MRQEVVPAEKLQALHPEADYFTHKSIEGVVNLVRAILKRLPKEMFRKTLLCLKQVVSAEDYAEILYRVCLEGN